MNRLSTQRFLPGFSSRHWGFTLIEILVAMAVLALVLVLMLQVVDSVVRSTRVQNQQMDSVEAARRALDIMEADLRVAVIARDSSLLAAQGSGPFAAATNPALAFLTTRRGPSGAIQHRFLYVAYALSASGELQRGFQSVPMTEKNLLQVRSLSPDEVETVATGVLRWEVLAVSTSGQKRLTGNATAAPWATDDYNGFAVPAGYLALFAPWAVLSKVTPPERVRALEVWVAVVDPQSYGLLIEQTGWSALQSQLSTASPEQWRNLIDGSDLPGPFKSSARILQKTIALP